MPKKQYSATRDNKELLFAFKKRVLVHFAVDDEAVYMATRIDENLLAAVHIFERVIEDQSFGALVKELMMKKVYARLNEDTEQREFR